MPGAHQASDRGRPARGADFGEIQAVAEAVGDGGVDTFHDAWIAAAARMSAEAEQALAGACSAAREAQRYTLEGPLEHIECPDA